MVFAYNRRFLWSYCCNLFKPSPAMPDPAANREHEEARWNPDRETVELATAGATKVLGSEHSATRALARAAVTMAMADLWRARLAVKTLSRDQREAIAAAAED